MYTHGCVRNSNSYHPERHKTAAFMHLINKMDNVILK